jgi:hypothetical protein
MLPKEDPSMENKKRPKPRTKAPGRDEPSPTPAYIIDMLKAEQESLDFDELKREFKSMWHSLGPILIPTQEEMDEMFVRKSLGLKSRYDNLFWWYALHGTSDAYRGLVEDYNTSLAWAGLLGEDQQGPTPESSHVAVISSGLSKGKISTRFIKAWGALGMLSGLYIALIQLGKEEEARSRGDFTAGVKSSNIGQRVWYARWLLANIKDVKKDRGTAEGKLAKICAGMVKGRRRLADEGPWDSHWFGKLLGASGVDLKDRLTRLSESQIRRLADHGRITADLLPPLNESAFIVATPRGGVTS